jgi:hypothetical protein
MIPIVISFFVVVVVVKALAKKRMRAGGKAGPVSFYIEADDD